MTTTNESVPEIKPEVVFAYDLVKQVARGAVRIPRFQRRFVWRRDQMIDLLDSIRRRYPIGSLLFWDTVHPFASFERVGPVKIPPSPDKGSTYVLDGQQRLSTLTGLLLRTGDLPDDTEDVDPLRWCVYFDVVAEVFMHVDPAEAQEHHFPMWKLLDTFEFLDECTRMRKAYKKHEEKARQYVERVQSLAENIKSYKLPVIRVGGTELKEAVEIFARLNSKGQRVTPDQIVSALAYEEHKPGETSFDLAKDIDELISVLSAQGFGDIDRVFVLRALLAALQVDIYRTDWTRIFHQREDLRKDLPGIVDECKESLRRATEFLQSLGVRSSRLLPYALQLVVLSEFFRHCPQPSRQQRALLDRWFWVSSFTGWFGSGNPSRTGWLIDEMRSVARDPNASDLHNIRLDTPAQPFPKTSDLRSARVRTHMLVVLSLGPRQPDGSPYQDAWHLITENGPQAFSYIFVHPRPMLTDDKELRSSPVNRILDTANQRGRGQAKKWLAELDDTVQNEVLESLGIPAAAVTALRAGSADEFLRARLGHLMAIEEDFMRKHGVSPPVDRRPLAAPIDTGDD